MKTISIVCSLRDENKHIKHCVESVLAGIDIPADQIEVLLVDGMSRDGTRDVIREMEKNDSRIALLDNPDFTTPYGLNRGIRAATGKYIIRIDAHAYYPDCYVKLLIDKMEELHAENVGGMVETLPAADTLPAQGIAAAMSSSFGMGNSYFRVGCREIREVDTVPFGCFRRELFDRIGYFDETLPRNQDDEFNGRIINNGGKIYLIPDLKIQYIARETIRKMNRMFYEYGLFKPLVNKKLGKPATLRQFVPPLFVAGLFAGIPLALLNPIFCVAYLSVVGLYLLMSIGCSIRIANHSRKWKLSFILPFIFFCIHFSYGCGYWKGIVKLLFHSSFQAKINH